MLFLHRLPVWRDLIICYLSRKLGDLHSVPISQFNRHPGLEPGSISRHAMGMAMRDNGVAGATPSQPHLDARWMPDQVRHDIEILMKI